jgi:hypothetical protein
MASYKEKLAETLDTSGLRELAAKKSQDISAAVLAHARFRMDNSQYLPTREKPEALGEIELEILSKLMVLWQSVPPAGTKWPSNAEGRQVALTAELAKHPMYARVKALCQGKAMEEITKAEDIEKAKRDRADVMFAWRTAIAILGGGEEIF